jgi:hypothetical protein
MSWQQQQQQQQQKYQRHLVQDLRSSRQWL